MGLTEKHKTFIINEMVRMKVDEKRSFVEFAPAEKEYIKELIINQKYNQPYAFSIIGTKEEPGACAVFKKIDNVFYGKATILSQQLNK